ncbi:hypothetical protein EfmAA610_29250 [Enterococcus faecium]|nr:hypothetical protein EfmAA610_29250 [Enterococcus faecium]
MKKKLNHDDEIGFKLTYKQMRLNGSTLADIAATLHVSIDTVHRVLKRDPDCCFIKVNTGRSRRLAKRHNSLAN